MEQVRLIIAIAASILVFILWDFFFVDKTVKNPAPIPQQEITESKKLTDSGVKSAPEALSQKSDKNFIAPSLQKSKKTKSITVETPLYIAELSEKGATIKSFILKGYKETIKEDSALKELLPQNDDFYNIKTSFKGNSVYELGDAFFSAEKDIKLLDVSSSSKSLAFYFKSEDGVAVKKEYIFSPDKYLIDVIVSVKNESEGAIKDELILSMFAKTPVKKAYGFEGPSGIINGKMQEVKLKSLEKQNTFSGSIKWIGISDRYFMTNIISEEETGAEASMRIFSQNNIVENQYIFPKFSIAAGDIKEFRNKLYFGPKSTSVMSKEGFELKKAVNFGMFDFLAKPCLTFMNFLYGVIPNYGVAIIILTIIIKFIFWPLGTKSYSSMNQMKRLQPEMAKIREKYKDDKKKINEEVMKLYKTFKVNPLSGCLPMLVQIPIFFALYRMLYGTIELRHAPFIGWINDLSAPDRLFNFAFSIPFMQPPYGIPVLTIIMGVTMFLQQKMSPPPGDPSQAKIMLFMPVFFTVIFINFSSGLVLYWLVNNVFSIAQQYYTNKRLG